MSAERVTDVGPVAKKRSKGVGRQDWSTWPTYEAADYGLSGQYWYPVIWSRQLGRKPVGLTLLGQQVVFHRDAGQVYALNDRCPHRGVPLSLGDQHFPGTLSCPYHGWTFELETGTLCGVLTDGPDCPLVGKVHVDRYPVEERLGLIWIFMGPDRNDGQPPPVETAIPDELLDHDFSLGGRITVRAGGWRFAAENGFDEGHAKYLHRTSLWRLFKLMPIYSKTRVIPTEGGWITRVQDEAAWESDFPGLGTWTNDRWWKRSSGKMLAEGPGKNPKADPVIASKKFPGNQSIRLPGLLRIAHERFIHYEWYVPVDEDRFRYVQMMVQFKTGRAGWLFKARYLAFIRWLFHGQFTGQDEWMVNVTDAPPERLYRPDVSITEWRRLCEGADPRGIAVSGGAAGEG